MSNSTLVPAFLAGWLQILAPQPCFDKFFVDFDLLDVPCLKVVISKGLGFAIIAGSVVVKVPQILKILGGRSGEGISIVSVTCELVAISASWSYGYAQKFPFSAYGEGVFLAFQTLLIALLVLFYSGKTATSLIYATIYAFTMMFLLSPMAPMPLLSALQVCNSPIVAISKIIQATKNYSNSSTGQLSAVSVFLLFAGSLARVFTSIQETGDMLIIVTFLVSTFFNGLIFAQVLYYWNVKTKKE